ncbi:response regulator [candidate division GN15 bacterium]|nr:response regulator [candidate division GN15 bacterium]
MMPNGDKPADGPCTILVVDDEQDVRTYLSLVLSQHGFEVETAETVTEAMEILRRLTVSLACIDIMMPKESGISLYKQIKLHPDLCHMPVLIISGAERENDFDFRKYVPDRKLPPPDGYIEKPIVIDRFVGTVSSLTTGGKGSHVTQ